MNNKEFVSTYSDDMTYLIEMKDSLLTHPEKFVIEELFIPSFTRIYCVYTVGNIEAMIINWNNAYEVDFLKNYLKFKGSNEIKISNLAKAFEEIGLEVDKEIIKDFEAIKHLRNTIIHSNWKPSDKTILKERNFPTDTRELNEKHLERISEVNDTMMQYISFACVFTENK